MEVVAKTSKAAELLKLQEKVNEQFEMFKSEPSVASVFGVKEAQKDINKLLGSTGENQVKERKPYYSKNAKANGFKVVIWSGWTAIVLASGIPTLKDAADYMKMTEQEEWYQSDYKNRSLCIYKVTEGREKDRDYAEFVRQHPEKF